MIPAAPNEHALLPAARHASDGLLPGPDTRPTIAAHIPELPAPTAGQMIGRYQLIEKIGEGGCGVVYVAEQCEPVHRRVALKVIKLGMDTHEVIARFDAERQALALMDHPNIAKVLDAGSTGDPSPSTGRSGSSDAGGAEGEGGGACSAGRPYFVMELVQGVRITEFCDAHELPTEARLDLFIQVCQAIQHAHQKGVIHRDIKPSNILVPLLDGEPVPKVIDFGIAKAVEGRLTDATVHTQLHHFIGTPAYMSPEQADMSGVDIDTRSDIYSLGVLLYELLTGTTPFDTNELLSAGIDGMRKTIRETDPVLPSARLRQTSAAAAATFPLRFTAHALRVGEAAPRQIANRNAPIDPDLDWIVMKCLEKDRSRRYETANGLAADLKRHLNDEPVVARPPSAGYRLRKAIRRNKLIFVSGTAILVALVIGLALNTRQLIQVNRLKLDLEKLAHDTKIAQAEAEAIAGLLDYALTGSLPSRDGRTFTIEKLLDRVAYRLNHQPPDQFSDWPRFHNAVAQLYRAYGRHDKAIPLLEKVHQRLEATLKPNDPELLAVKSRLAYSYSAVKRPDEALLLREEILEHGGPGLLTAMSEHALALEQMGRWDQAIEQRQTLVDLHRKTSGPDHIQTLAAQRRLGDSYEGGGREDDALRTWEELLPLLQTVLGTGARESLQTLARLASAYTAREWHVQAIARRWEILQSNLNSLKGHGLAHPETVDAVHRFADACEASGRLTEAQQLREGVVMAMEGSWPPGANHPLRILVTRVGQRLEIVTQTNAVR